MAKRPVKTVTICDHTFIEHSRSASLGGDNTKVYPQYFKWEYADAMTARFVTGGDIKHARGYGQVAWLLEPYDLHPENYRMAWERQEEFDAILMHSHHETFGAKWYPYGGSWIHRDDWGHHHKTKLISMIISDKDTMPGHKLRKIVEKEFHQDIDIWKDFPDKVDALAPYKYSIVIESEKADFYFTEKLIDCLCVHTVPIYWGCNLNMFFNTDGIIKATDFLFQQIAKVLESGEDDYWSHSDAVLQNAKLAQNYAITEDRIYYAYPELFE